MFAKKGHGGIDFVKRLKLHVERLRDLLHRPDERRRVGRPGGRAALGGAHGQRRRHVGLRQHGQRLLRRSELSRRFHSRGHGEEGAGLGVFESSRRLHPGSRVAVGGSEDGLRGARSADRNHRVVR